MLNGIGPNIQEESTPKKYTTDHHQTTQNGLKRAPRHLLWELLLTPHLVKFGSWKCDHWTCVDLEVGSWNLSVSPLNICRFGSWKCDHWICVDLEVGSWNLSVSPLSICRFGSWKLEVWPLNKCRFGPYTAQFGLFVRVSPLNKCRFGPYTAQFGPSIWTFHLDLQFRPSIWTLNLDFQFGP